MKKLLSLFVFLLVVYVIYYDLTTGTLPVPIEKTTVAQENNREEKTTAKQKNYFVQKVKSGDTVLSIVEKNLDDSLPVSIEDVITDFQNLNNGLQPEDIQPGNKYKFPDYHDFE
jgi:hypothetical protein